VEILKYPRTRHVSGSRLQRGDEDLDVVPLEFLEGRHVVVEEKLDGANSGLRFTAGGEVRLQSRGHFLTGGPRETQFTLFKQWVATFADDLFLVLGDGYGVYGEWMYSKHTVFYDALPHYWMEFDVCDYGKSAKTGEAIFLDTRERRRLLSGVPVVSVPVLWEGTWERGMSPREFIKTSLYKTPMWRNAMDGQARSAGQSEERVKEHTDPSDLMEGVYIKVEEGGRVVERLKYVRDDFTSLLITNDEHHSDRAMVANGLAAGTDMFRGVL